MKILLVHEFYQSNSPSGEDAMFRMERDLLQRAGHEVATYEVHNDDIGATLADRLRVAAATPWSRSSRRALTRVLERNRPEIAHFHNTFPLISPSAFSACSDLGVPVVQTLHNYRLVCPGGLLQRDGHPCEQCVGRSPLPAIAHRCYRSSRAATTVAVTMLLYNRLRGTYAHDVDRYVVLTEFGRRVLIRGGLPAEKLTVRPNGLTDDPGAGGGEGNFALYAGQLSAEKGARTMIRAWHAVEGLPLVVAGDGDQRIALEEEARQCGVDVRFIGQRPRAEILSLMRSARIVVIPSECYEGLPVTYVEAMACGAPVVASRLGALAEILTDRENGAHFAPGNPAELASAVNELIAQPDRVARIRLQNRRLFEERYSPTAALRSLEAIYRAVSTQRKQAALTRSPQASREPLGTHEAGEDGS